MVTELTVLSESDALPFAISEKAMVAGAPSAGADNVSEDLRLQYRYLDLRRPSMRDNLMARHRIFQCVREFLDSRGFVEVETPVLTASTPEGARDYLVPSRVHPQSFYALPQSPQLFKQLLMIGGMERYFQMARCFRDEDLRPNRQPEFTQLDIEASFIDEEFIYELVEELTVRMFAVGGISLSRPFPRMTWTEAMDTTGSDRPDLRFGLRFVDVTDVFSANQLLDLQTDSAARRLHQGHQHQGPVRQAQQERAAERIRQGDRAVVRRQGHDLDARRARQTGIQHRPVLQQPGTGRAAPAIRRCRRGRPHHDRRSLVRHRHLGAGPAAAASGEPPRPDSGQHLLPGLGHGVPAVRSPPRREASPPATIPFTAPDRTDFDPKNIEELLTLRSRAYDLVMNGEELGGGSIRINDRDVQRKIFAALGLTEEETKERFGFFLRAFDFGAPPHGGLALGMDRTVSMILQTPSIREVIAFPKNRSAACPLTGAPSAVKREQLAELGLLNLGGQAVLPGTAAEGEPDRPRLLGVAHRRCARGTRPDGRDPERRPRRWLRSLPRRRGKRSRPTASPLWPTARARGLKRSARRCPKPANCSRARRRSRATTSRRPPFWNSGRHLDGFSFRLSPSRDAAAPSGGPLQGLRIAIQPNISVAGWPTEAGSNALANFTALEDATIVQRLRQAGASLCGSTRMSEFGFGLQGSQAGGALQQQAADVELVLDFMGESRLAAVARRSLRFQAQLGTGVALRPDRPDSVDGMLRAPLREVSRHIREILKTIAGQDGLDFSLPDEETPGFLPAEDRPEEDHDRRHHRGATRLAAEQEKMFQASLDELKKAGFSLREMSFPDFPLFSLVHQIVGSVEASSRRRTL